MFRSHRLKPFHMPMVNVFEATFGASVAIKQNGVFRLFVNRIRFFIPIYRN